MAEAKKEEKKIRVMVATFTASCGDRAKNLKDDLAAAGYERFEVKPAEGLPGYIMVETACGEPGGGPEAHWRAEGQRDPGQYLQIGRKKEAGRLACLHNTHYFILRGERIVVGEVRGGEALDMLQAMNTGHDGSLSTGHANSTRDMLSRLETMVLQGAPGLPLEAIRQQIASAVDIIIHLSRLRDKTRKTMEITEVVGYRDGQIKLNPLYVFEEDKNSTLERVSGGLKRTENRMENRFKLQLSGIKTEI